MDALILLLGGFIGFVFAFAVILLAETLKRFLRGVKKMIPGDSYQKFMPYQQGDFDEKMRDLNWWQWPLFLIAVAILIIWACFYTVYEWIRYRGKGDFVPDAAKHNYRIKLEKK